MSTASGSVSTFGLGVDPLTMPVACIIPGFPIVFLHVQWLQESNSSGDIRDLYFLDQRDMRWVCARSLDRRVSVSRRGQVVRCSQSGPPRSRDMSTII